MTYQIKIFLKKCLILMMINFLTKFLMTMSHIKEIKANFKGTKK